MYLAAMNTGLAGRRGGPQDAFRHTLASAYISKYIHPTAVDIFTYFSERDAASIHDRMDIHNNMNGKRIGKSSNDIYQAVVDSVKKGEINSSDSNVSTWLIPEKWDNGL